MASLLDSLNIGGTSLVTQQLGLQVTGNNIANASTEGFHRQQVVFESLGGTAQGVRLQGIRRMEDQFLMQQLGAQAGQYGRANARSESLSRLEEAVGGLGELGLSAYLDRFFSSWRELGGSPHDEFQRLDTVSTTEELATAINRTADQFSAAQKEADQEVVRGVAEANTMIKEIASLNHEIMENEAYGDAANSMRDRRDLLLQSLGDLVGATNFINDKGHAVVTLSGGTTVVTGIGTQLLETQLDAATGFHNVTVEGTTNMSLADSMSGGRVKGFLDVRDKDIAGRVRELDTFALDLATAVNNVHRSNFNLNGTDNVDLFTPPGTSQGAATSLKVNAAVVSDTSLLAASSTAGGIPGNGVGAMGMADLEFEDVAGGNSRKLSASVNQILTNLGYSVRDADQATERTSLRLRQLTNLRESSSGVSIEEEMIQLTRYQRSFQAASKIISAVDDMLGIVLNI